MEIKVFCIIVTYNGIKWINKCLTSITQIDFPVKTIVIDNGSKDGTQRVIKESFPETELIESAENLGFGKANNIGIEKAISSGANYVFLLNQDAFFIEGSFKSMIDLMESNKSLGILSPIHYAGDEVHLDYKFQGYVKKYFSISFDINKTYAGNEQFYVCNFINAAAWLVSVDMLIKTGLFHPIFPHYSEDMEFVHRIKQHDFEIGFTPLVSIIHDRPQFDPPETLDNQIRYFENSMYMSYLMYKKSRPYIFLFMLLSLIKDCVMLNFKLANRKLVLYPGIVRNLYKY